MQIKPTDQQISELENKAFEAQDEGSRYPGMSFEQGITDTIAWLRGDSDESPLGED